MSVKRKISSSPIASVITGDLASFTMQALVRQTGIAPDTLRAWERRYGFPVPARTAGGHRLYTARDAEAIRWVLQKQQEGLRAKQAIELWHHQGLAPAPVTGVSAPALHQHETLEVLRNAWVQACLTLDDQAASQVFNSAAAMLGPESALLHVATAGLSQVGELWAAGSASVAQEHFSSATAIRHAYSLLNGEPPPSRAEKLLVTCPEGEIHVYPAVVLTYLLRRAGWNVIFLNANLPERDLMHTIAQEVPMIVLICVQTVPALSALLSEAEALGRLGMPVGFGGSVFIRYPGLNARVPGVYLGNQLSDAAEVLPRVLNGSLKPNAPMPLDDHWQELYRALPGALLQVEADVRRKSEPLDLSRESVEAEMQLVRGYLLSVVKLGAAELLPGVWEWTDRMLTARGFSADARAAILTGYRESLRRHLKLPGPLSIAL